MNRKQSCWHKIREQNGPDKTLHDETGVAVANNGYVKVFDENK